MGRYDIKKFVLFTYPRTRSNLLCNHLDSNPAIVCHYEIFHPDEVYIKPGYAQAIGLTDAHDTETRDKDCLKFIASIFRTDLSNQARAIGFKIFPEHNAIARRHLAENHTVLKILLHRNLLYAYTSWMIALNYNEWTSRSIIGSSGRRISVNIEEFLEWKLRIDSFVDEITMLAARSGSRCLQIESVAVPDGSASAEVTRALGLKPTTPASYLVPQNAPSLRKRIQNYSALRTALTARGLGHLFVEDAEQRAFAVPD